MPTVGLCPIGRPYGDWGSQWTGQACEWPTWPFTGLVSPAPVWETCILGWRQGKALMWVWWFSLPTYPHGQPQPPLCQMPWSQGPSQFTFQWETLYLTPTTCQALGLCQRSHTTPFFGRKRRWTEREMTCPRPDGGQEPLWVRVSPARDLSLHTAALSHLSVNGFLSLHRFLFPLHWWRITG